MSVIAALVSLALLQALVSFWGAAQIDFVGNYDTGYYYAVARNISEGRLDSDDVLWHWLGAPVSVARPAGDYWGPGWPYLLGGLMAVAGNSMKASIWICAVLSLALPLLAFWLVMMIQDRVLPAWLAGAILVPQERMVPSDFTPDIALPMQITVLLGLCLFVRALKQDGRSRFSWYPAGFILAIPQWLRSDGFLVCAAALAATLVRPRVQSWTRLEQTGRLLAGAAACVVPFLAYNIWAFGVATPSPRSMVPWMVGFTDLYRYETDPSFERFRAQGSSIILSRIQESLLHRVERLPGELPLPLLVLGAVGCFAGWRGKDQRGLTLVLPFLVVLFWLVPAVLAPRVSYNPGRFTQLTAPIACVLAGLSIGEFLHRVRARRSIAIAAACTFAFSSIVWFWPFDPRNPLAPERWTGPYAKVPEFLAAEVHPPLRPGDVVMSTDPWEVAAVLGVPAIMAPIDSAEAIRKVIARYHPRYLLLVKRSLWYAEARMAGARGLWTGIRARVYRETRDAVWYELPGN